MNCGTCRYWSELITRSFGLEIKALCLNPKSSHHQGYRAASDSCQQREEATDGAVDDPRKEPLRYTKAKLGV
jgi:hypothetical protein